MKTLNYAPAIKKITDRLDVMDCRYSIAEDKINLEWSMNDLQDFGIDVYALLEMDEIADKFGADWESPSVISIWIEDNGPLDHED